MQKILLQNTFAISVRTVAYHAVRAVICTLHAFGFGRQLYKLIIAFPLKRERKGGGQRDDFNAKLYL
jgi:hypothetical protein